MDQWETIRIRCVRDREPMKRVARDLGLSKNTIRKYVRSLSAPQARAASRSRRLDAYSSHIDELLRQSPRITAARIATVLRERVDPDLQIGERAMRVYVARRRALLIPKEAFVRAVYAPGSQSQFDFTPVKVTIAGILTVVHLFVMRLSYSGRLFARASLRCDQPALFQGILEALLTFGGVPNEGVFDNASTAVVRVLQGRSREENAAFRAFCGALAFPIVFAAPAKGNEKGGVEGANRYVQANFFTPTPEFASLIALNEKLALFCEHDQSREHSVHHERIVERFAREDQELRALPQPLPRACIVRPVHVNKFSEVVVETNRYSVPTRYAHRAALVEIYDQHLRIVVDDNIVAEHPRASGKGKLYLDPRHYLTLLSHKHRAVARAAVFADGRLPQTFLTLRDRYIARNPNLGTKAWMSVVSLLAEHPIADVDAAIVHAIARGTDDPAAIALLLRQRAHPSSSATLNVTSMSNIPADIVAAVDLGAWAIANLAEQSA